METSFLDRSSFRPLHGDACWSVASQIVTYPSARLPVARVGRGSTLTGCLPCLDVGLSETK